MKLFVLELFEQWHDFLLENLILRLPKIPTSLSIANFEIIIINPLERLKVWLMTSPKRMSIPEFFHINRQQLITELYRGTSAVFYRQNVSWVTFLYVDEITKTKYRQYKQSEHLAHFDLFITGMLVGLINTCAMMPFDYVKTQKQKYYENNKSMFDIMKITFKQSGIRQMK